MAAVRNDHTHTGSRNAILVHSWLRRVQPAHSDPRSTPLHRLGLSTGLGLLHSHWLPARATRRLLRRWCGSRFLRRSNRRSRRPPPDRQCGLLQLSEFWHLSQFGRVWAVWRTERQSLGFGPQ